LQIRDPGADVGQVRGSEGAGLSTWTLAMIRQVEELPNLVDREPEGASPTDEREPLEVFGPVEAIASGAAGRRGQEPNAFVVPDGLHLGPGALRQGPDGEASWRGVHIVLPDAENSLESVVTTGFTVTPHDVRAVPGGEAMELEIKTAEELVDPALEARWTARREARLTDVLQTVLRAFRDRGGPVSLEEITVALPGRPVAVVRETLVALDAEDLIQLLGDRVELAYPFSAMPTAFTVRFADGAERYACCAIDALGMAPMLGQPVRIHSQCHHCQAPLMLQVGPDHVGPGSEAVMVWVGTRSEDQRRVATSL
jgi:hypothetical protein